MHAHTLTSHTQRARTHTHTPHSRTRTHTHTRQTRRNGEEWLITSHETESHLPGVYEEVVGVVNLTVLSNRQYAVIQDPCESRSMHSPTHAHTHTHTHAHTRTRTRAHTDDEDGKQVLGAQKMVKGPASFFLRPGEVIAAGIQDFYILGDDEGLILRAVEAFDETVSAISLHARMRKERLSMSGRGEGMHTRTHIRTHTRTHT